MQVHENFSLKSLNTFGVDAKARYFGCFSNVEDLQELVSSGVRPMILGGGSNVLFCDDYEGLVLKNEIGGIEVAREDAEHVFVKAGAGVVWHDLVMFAVEKGWGGLENLSLIPGSVGASPMQNIGAYGVEVKDVFEELDAYDLEDKCVHTFRAADCEFGYRDSVFKRRLKDRFVILQVTYRLRKEPVFSTGYGAIASELERMGVKDVSVRAVSDAVIRIRRSKLPDPAVLGNAGSFFKNPIVGEEQLSLLLSRFDVPYYSFGVKQYKIPAGWLIEQCGWKGVRQGPVGCYEKQALVIVNYGGASGKEIMEFSEGIKEDVAEHMGILLEREVNVPCNVLG